MNRSNTNRNILEEANNELNKDKNNSVRLRPYSEVYTTRKVKLFAQVITAENDDPVKTATLNPETFKPWDVGYRRRGRPRKCWTDQTARRLWQTNQQVLPEGLQGKELNLDDVEHRNAVMALAGNVKQHVG